MVGDLFGGIVSTVEEATDTKIIFNGGDSGNTESAGGTATPSGGIPYWSSNYGELKDIMPYRIRGYDGFTDAVNSIRMPPARGFSYADEEPDEGAAGDSYTAPLTLEEYYGQEWRPRGSSELKPAENTEFLSRFQWQLAL